VAAVKSSLSQALPLVEYGVSSVTAEGQNESGDSYLVKPVRQPFPGDTQVTNLTPRKERAYAALSRNTASWAFKRLAEGCRLRVQRARRLQSRTCLFGRGLSHSFRAERRPRRSTPGGRDLAILS
jgi:hypothetical protein